MKDHLLSLFQEIQKDYEGKDLQGFIDEKNAHPGKFNVSAQLVEFGDARTRLEEVMSALQIITNVDMSEKMREAQIPVFEEKIQAVIDILEAPEVKESEAKPE